MHHFKDSKAFKNERQLPTDLCSHGTDSKKTTDGQKIKNNHSYQLQSTNPLDSKGNYSATADNTKLVHWPSMGGLLNLVQQEGAWPARPVPSSLYQM